jgi:hypothetical protein
MSDKPLVHYGQPFQIVILKTVQSPVEVSDMLNVSHFDFRARHSTTSQYMKPTDHVTLNFNNMSVAAAVFLDIKKSL